MASPITVRVVADTETEQWTRLLAGSPDASIYSTPEYLDVLASVTGGRYQLVGVWMGDQLSAGIGLFRERLWYGEQAAPRLLLYYHSPVVRQFETKYPSERTSRHVRLLGALAEHLAAERLASITLKCRHTVTDVRPFVHAGWVCSPSYTYVVPIDNLDAQFPRVEQNLRRLINRAESHGITVTDDDDTATFHRLHAATMHRRDVGLYLSADAFTTYYARLRTLDLCRMYMARLPDGTAIAGQLVLLGPGGVSHTVMAVTDDAHLKLGASPFLRWKAFEALAALGYAGNDLTDAALNPVTHFKSQLGGSLELCHVLQRPQGALVRFGERANHLRWRARAMLDGAMRRRERA